MRKHLKQGPRASLQPARGLGRQAVVLALGMGDLARIHEQALIALVLSGYGEATLDSSLRMFLFDQGVDYPFSTPRSASGRAARLQERRNDRKQGRLRYQTKRMQGAGLSPEIRGRPLALSCSRKSSIKPFILKGYFMLDLAGRVW